MRHLPYSLRDNLKDVVDALKPEQKVSFHTRGSIHRRSLLCPTTQRKRKFFLTPEPRHRPSSTVLTYEPREPPLFNPQLQDVEPSLDYKVRPSTFRH